MNCMKYVRLKRFDLASLKAVNGGFLGSWLLQENRLHPATTPVRWLSTGLISRWTQLTAGEGQADVQLVYHQGCLSYWVFSSDDGIAKHWGGPELDAWECWCERQSTCYALFEFQIARKRQAGLEVELFIIMIIASVFRIWTHERLPPCTENGSRYA